MHKIDYIFLIFLLLLILISLKPEQIILSSETFGFESTTFNDQKDNGNSKALIFSDSLGHSLKYFVGSQYLYPYVGVSISKKEDGEPIDLSGFQEMIIEIDPHHSDNINCMLNFYTALRDHPNQSSIKQILLAEILVDSSQTYYSFNLNKLTTPQWWYQTHGVNKNDLIELNYRQFVEISFSNHPNLPHDSSYQFLIKSISFKKHNWQFTIVTLALLIIYGLFLIIRKIKSSINTITYQPITLTTNNKNPEDLVKKFIGQNYANPDLTLKSVTKNTGIPSAKVRSILQKTKTMGFRAFVNGLRIAEAQRLINNTENPISEIALSVGYRHLSTFNAAFKEITGLTPSEFRSQKQ